MDVVAAAARDLVLPPTTQASLTKPLPLEMLCILFFVRRYHPLKSKININFSMFMQLHSEIPSNIFDVIYFILEMPFGVAINILEGGESTRFIFNVLGSFFQFYRKFEANYVIELVFPCISQKYMVKHLIANRAERDFINSLFHKYITNLTILNNLMILSVLNRNHHLFNLCIDNGANDFRTSLNAAYICLDSNIQIKRGVISVKKDYERFVENIHKAKANFNAFNIKNREKYNEYCKIMGISKQKTNQKDFVKTALVKFKR